MFPPSTQMTVFYYETSKVTEWACESWNCPTICVILRHKATKTCTHRESKSCTHGKTELLRMLLLCQQPTSVFKCSQPFQSNSREREDMSIQHFYTFCRFKSPQHEVQRGQLKHTGSLNPGSLGSTYFNSCELGTPSEMDSWGANLAAASCWASLPGVQRGEEEKSTQLFRNKARGVSRYLCSSAVNHSRREEERLWRVKRESWGQSTVK